VVQFEKAHSAHLLQLVAVVGRSDKDIARGIVAVAAGQAKPDQVLLVSVDRPWSAAGHGAILQRVPTDASTGDKKGKVVNPAVKQKPEDIAQICQKGHLIVGSIKRHADFGAPFCEKCGAPTITSCQKCDWPIRGISPTAWMADSGPYRPPSFCGECGTPFPWTKAALDAAKCLADEQNELTADEKTQLKTSIDEMTSDTALTPVAAGKFKTLVKKIGPQAGEMLKSLVLAVATSEAKKYLGLP